MEPSDAIRFSSVNRQLAARVAELERDLADEMEIADRLACCIERMPWIYGIGESEAADEALKAWKESRKS